MGTNKPIHYAKIINPDRSEVLVKKTTKMWKAFRALKELKYSDYPEGTVFVISSVPPGFRSWVAI